jgi:hypothetical protein
MNIELTDIDKRKISRSQTYRAYQKITIAKNKYKQFEVGTALFIKRIGEDRYVTKGGWRDHGKKPPIKFVIIENDDGFLFAKKVLASGQLGTDITCLTTDYGPERWELIPDDAMVDAMLLDEEYDPTADAKVLKKKKNKATRINKKHRLIFDRAKDAYDYINSLQVGQKLWTSGATFGENVAEYKVANIERKQAKESDAAAYGRHRKVHRYHLDENFPDIVTVYLELESGGSKWTNQMQTIHFYNMCKSKKEYKYHDMMLHDRKPVTPKEVDV